MVAIENSASSKMRRLVNGVIEPGKEYLSQANSKGADEPVHLHSLARAFAVHSHDRRT